MYATLFLLAQSEDGLKKAEDALDLIDKLGKAGPVTLSLAIAVVTTAFAVYMLRKNWSLREEHAIELKKREQDAKNDADARLKDVLAAEKERRETEKQMLREMVEHGHDAAQALEGSNRAIEAFKAAMDGYLRRLDELDRTQEKRFDELLRAINQKGNS